MGTLSESEKAQFESQLQADPILQQQVSDVKTMLSGIEGAILKDRMEVFHEEIESNANSIPEPIKKPRRTLYYGLGFAASLALFAMLYFGPFSENANKSLYDTYFEPDPGLPTTMGSTSDFEFYDAMVDYKKGDFNAAISKWETLPNGTKGDTLTYFLGVAHLANTNETKAIEYLAPLSQQPNPAFAKETQYYLGLAYLKKNDTVNAKRALEASGTPGALKILAELNQ